MEFQTARRGLSAHPLAGWPLDDLLVGTATLGTLRQLLDSSWPLYGEAVRPWDVALWSGLTPQGTRHSVERLESCGLVGMTRPPWRHRAAYYRLRIQHPFVGPLQRLFAAERRQAGEMGFGGRPRRRGRRPVDAPAARNFETTRPV